MSKRLEVDGPTWARYAQGTAGREPMRFIHRAIELTHGDSGAGRLVIDLGSGAGNETFAFLERGWRVHAVDGEPGAMAVLEGRIQDEHRSSLTTEVGKFHELELPAANLVFASLSLPFAALHFEESVASAWNAVKPGGWFVGVLLGLNDTWAPDDDTVAVARDEIPDLFPEARRLYIEEEEFDGPSSVGDKHWHWFVVSARRPL